MDISFIIPARNEEQHIQKCLLSITNSLDQDKYKYEVIVVDDNSTDSTAAVSETLGALVIEKGGGTIARARNTGAAQARGWLLIFLDADVEVTSRWRDNIENSLLRIKISPRLITGSTVSVPERQSWLEQAWFNGRRAGNNHNYINSGHLILHHDLFDELGGFDDALATGEDYDLCHRAKAIHAQIEDDANLPVIHHGYPKTIRAFIIREIWHGTGDAQTLERFLASRVAIAASAFLIAHLVILMGIALTETTLVIAGLLFILIESSMIVVRRFYAPSYCGQLMLAYVYLLSRAISIVARIMGIRVRGHRINSRT